MIVKNDQADIGPTTTKLNQVSAGVYAITGGYISQPGGWNIALKAQRPSDYDPNYKFTSKVNGTASLVTQPSSRSATTIFNNTVNSETALYDFK